MGNRSQCNFIVMCNLSLIKKGVYFVNLLFLKLSPFKYIPNSKRLLQVFFFIHCICRIYLLAKSFRTQLDYSVIFCTRIKYLCNTLGRL